MLNSCCIDKCYLSMHKNFSKGILSFFTIPMINKILCLPTDSSTDKSATYLCHNEAVAESSTSSFQQSDEREKEARQLSLVHKLDQLIQSYIEAD